jgi:hypothetical protein
MESTIMNCIKFEARNRIVYAVSLVFAFFAFAPHAARATTRIVGPSDCSAAAVNAVISASGDGDTVSVTCTGTVTWTSAIQIPSTKGIKLIGPGNNTPKSSASFPLTVVTNADPAISILAENGRAFSRISGFKFQRSSEGKLIGVSGRGTGSDGLGAYRIDNNYFDHTNGAPIILLDGSNGELTGLVDNNTFLDVGVNRTVYVIMIRETYKGGTASCYGWDAWQRPFSFGSNRFHFIEDNLFYRPTTEGRHDVSSDGAGGKFVVRYNSFNRTYGSSYQLDYVDAHGDGTQGLGTGARGGEFYHNTFQGTSNSVGRNFSIRGGQWLIYDNTFTGGTPIAFTEYRASSADSYQMENPSRCNPGVPQFATSANFATWYPLPGQIRGTYLWNNLYNGGNVSPGLASENYVSTYVQANRDYWVSTSKPTALAGYTPYSYPHPLRGGAVVSSLRPPQNLRLQ